MKTAFLKPALFAILTSTLIVSCVKDSDYDVPNTDCVETTLVKTKEVIDIPASPIPIQYVADDVIEAYVTSSDRGGNFYKSISFQTLDGSAGFSVPVDVTNTYTNFEPGRKVLIKMKDLYTDSPNSGPIGMRIGGLYVNPTSGVASVGRLSFSQYGKVLNRGCTVVNEDNLVIPVTINQAKSDAYLNRLVEIDNVQFSDAAITTTYYDALNDLGGATNHSVIDVNGNSIIFRTSSFATYSGNQVATGSGKIRGVITKYNSDYQFIARYEEDIKLDKPRFIPFLNETFDTSASFDLWTKHSVTGAQVWTYSATFGNPGGMAKMSGFSTVNNANEDWLISPMQDLSNITTANLSFDNAYKFTGNPIQVYISNNYSGSGSPYDAGVTWTQLTGAILSTGNYVYANSGSLDISGFTGAGNNHVYIAFKYTSTSSAASTWELDNIKIVGN